MTNWLEGKEKRQRENRKITIKLKKQNLKNKSGNGDFPDSHDPTVFVYSLSIFSFGLLLLSLQQPTGPSRLMSESNEITH
jgi:hypothetical protein